MRFSLSLLAFIFLFCSHQTFAQAQHNNWYFGNQAGVDFSSGNPVSVSNGQLTTTEASSSISDANGNLLFYTNGNDVWDANHNLMPNGSGLLGNISSGVIILPKPGSTTLFYIFTTDAAHNTTNNSGLTFSEVDMTLNGGTGDLTATKNVQLSATNGEWLTAVPHGNCSDIWLLTHGNSNTSTFMAFQISSTGVNPTPITTDLGLAIPAGIPNIGLMRPNRTGDKIIMTLPHFSFSAEILDFDRNSGSITNMTNLHTTTNFDRIYGIEYSRSGNVLYAGDFQGDVYQYDMTAANIPATRTLIAGLPVPGEIGQLQIGPNDKIYFGTNIYAGGSTFLSVINNPETIGTGANLQFNGVALSGNNVQQGLPWYYTPDSSTNPQVNLGMDTTICNGSTLIKNVASGITPTSYLWSDNSTDSLIVISAPGTYWIERQIGTCLPTFDTITVSVDTTTLTVSISDTTGCAPLSIDFTANASPSSASNYVWNMGDGSQINTQNPRYTYTTAGQFTPIVSATSINNCPISIVPTTPITILSAPLADFSITPNGPIEPGTEVHFTDESIGTIINWEWEINTAIVSNANNFTQKLESDIDYRVQLEVENQFGCKNAVTKIIPMINYSETVFIPNSFTPNGDEFNDVFQAIAPENILIDLKVYNRWGELLWNGQHESHYWSGTINNSPAPEGMYIWTAKIRSENGIISKTGHVALLR